MILEHPEKHLTDQEFFTIIKFFSLIIEKKEINEGDDYPLSFFGLGSNEDGTIFNNLFMSAQVLELEVHIEKGYNFATEVKNAKNEAKKEPEKKQKILLKIIKKIEGGKKIKISEIGTVSWIWYEVYSHIRFMPSEYKIPKKLEAVFRIEIDKYLDKLISDTLSIHKKNYYRFEALKKVLIKLIEDGKKIKLYGENFIITEKIDSDGSLEKLPDFCLIQTLYALQKLGYLDVVDIWETRKYPKGGVHIGTDVEPKRYINTNIILKDVFIDDINNQYKKENPKNTIEKFDDKRGVLSFAGQKIELAKKGKETDAVLLLKTLLKEKSANWVHNDEILTDWGYNDADQETVPKNKVYFAGQKVNNAVALKTQIEDFLECNTSKARINPKYKEVDE